VFEGLAGNDIFIVGIGWDIDIETVGPSWLDEAHYRMNDGGLVVRPATGVFNPGSANFASPIIMWHDWGALLISGAPSPYLVVDGILTIELTDGFDDEAGAIDAYASGSFTFLVDYKIPSPSALVILCLGAVAATSRRGGARRCA
jgi:hypothetical protein